MGQVMTNAFKERIRLADIEFNHLVPGGSMSEQPRCLTCEKPYYKDHPEEKDGCKCDPKDRKVLKEALD
jgi:hypothetical protein